MAVHASCVIVSENPLLVGFQLEEEVHDIVTVPVEAQVHELRSADMLPSVAMVAVPVVHGVPKTAENVHENYYAVQEEAVHEESTGTVKKSSRTHEVTVELVVWVLLGGVYKVKCPLVQSL